MIEPDNKQVYQNMIIPPQQTFVTCMEFLQNYYGVYNKGISYYFTKDILYVFPTYETKPKTLDSAHFYYAGADAVTGVELYHAYSEANMIHVVVSSTPVIRDLTDGGIENFGNTRLFQHSDRIVDLYSTIGEGKGSTVSRMGMGQLDLKEPNTSIFSLKDTDFGISKDAYNIVYKHTSNLFREKSEIYSYMRSLIGIQWQNAYPDSFKPGHLIHYHYDGEDMNRRTDSDELDYADSAEYMTRDGVCEQVTYTFKPVQGGGTTTKMWHSCVADIVLSVEYEPAPEEKTAEINTDMVTFGQSAFTPNASIAETPNVADLININGVVGLFDLK